MYAVMITFRSSIPVTQLAAPFEEYASALRKQPGLITKVWIHDGATVGGFHVFENKETADAYLSSELAAGLRETGGFDDFDVRSYGVLEDLSAITGVSVTRPLAQLS